MPDNSFRFTQDSDGFNTTLNNNNLNSAATKQNQIQSLLATQKLTFGRNNMIDKVGGRDL